MIERMFGVQYSMMNYELWILADFCYLRFLIFLNNKLALQDWLIYKNIEYFSKNKKSEYFAKC
jgi:hypothetical protein